MKNAIIIFVYNRPDMLIKMLDSLSKCSGIMLHDLFFFSDGPKSEEDENRVRQVRQLVDEYTKRAEFRRSRIICREKNIGLARSIITGVSEVINSYDAIICLEDDLVFSNDFLEYMDRALECYKDDKRIWSISGYCQDLNALKDKKINSFLSYRGSSLGWGTWADRWNPIDWDVKDYNSFRKNKRARKEFSRGGYDLPFFLDFQMCGLIDSWAIRWCYAQYKENQYSLFPAETRVTHIGWNSDATHAKKIMSGQQSMKATHGGIGQFDAVISEEILNEFRDYYRINYFKAYIKLILKTKFGIRI